MSNKVKKAAIFAAKCHKGQVRKYTGKPYIVHPAAVAHTINSFGYDDDMICAAWLHDVVEDCGISLDTISDMFGHRVANLVSDLSDVSLPSDGNRAARMLDNYNHTAQAHKDAKTIKLADLIDNTACIVKHDKDFAIVYIKEKQRLLDVLTEGDKDLYNIAKAQVDLFLASLT